MTEDNEEFCEICNGKLPKGNNTWHCGVCWMNGSVETKSSECGKYCYAIRPRNKLKVFTKESL